MKRKYLVFSVLKCFIFGVFISFYTVRATEVTPLNSQERQSVLDQAEFFINYPINLKKVDIKAIHFLFLPKDAVTQQEDEKVDFNVYAADEDVLRELLQTHQPKGLISRNGEWYIILQSGPLKKGSEWTVNLAGMEYKMLILDVNPKEYVVQYNESTEKIPFSSILKVKSKEKSLTSKNP